MVACYFSHSLNSFKPLFQSNNNNNNNNNNVPLPARISRTLSHHPSLSSIAPGRSSRLYPIVVVYRFLLIVLPLLVHVKGPTGVYTDYEFVLTSPAVYSMPGSSNFDRSNDGWKVVVHLFCGVLPAGLIQNWSHHFCAIIQLASMWCIRIAVLARPLPGKKTAFYFIGQVWLPYDNNNDSNNDNAESI